MSLPQNTAIKVLRIHHVAFAHSSGTAMVETLTRFGLERTEAADVS